MNRYKIPWREFEALPCGSCSALTRHYLVLSAAGQKLGFSVEWSNDFDEGLRIDTEDPDSFLPVSVPSITQSKKF
jgi:hypothetical protein